MSPQVIFKIILSPLLVLLGLIYAVIMVVRNICYDLGFLKSFRVGSRVISVGNITAGGTGKTPVTAFLAQAFGSSAIVSRGYGGTYAEPFTQVKSELKNASEIFGDEPTWFAEKLPDTPVWVGSDKVTVSKALVAAYPKVDLIFADDAFQHRRLKRDLDIVVIDASVSPLDYLPLPLGRGREDFYLGIRRADILVLNKVNLAKPKRVVRIRKILAYLKADRTALIEASVIIELFTFLNSKKTLLAPELKGKSLFLVSGIARPEQFLKLVSELTGAYVKGHMELKDHSLYGKEVISKIEILAAEADAQYIVVTEKDAVKLTGVNFKIPVIVSQLKLSAPELLDAVRSRISR